jgi:RNA polymerase sigma factor (sigma-70 family)
MPQHVVFHGVPDHLKEPIRNYWDRKWQRLERLLQSFPPDQRHLRLVIHNHHPVWDARAVLMLSSGTLVAQGKGYDDNYREALDTTAGRLAEEVRRHKGLLRHDYLYHRKRRRQRDFVSIRSAVEERHAGGDREAFAELLRAAMRGLQDHARRELIVAQLEGALRPNELTVSDVVDEAVTKAYEQFDQRPAGPLEPWLTRLLHDVIDAHVRDGRPAAAGIDERIPTDDPRFRVDGGWLVENEPFWGEVEPPLTLEQVLPSDRAVEPWQEVAADEQHRWILARLRSFPQRQRRAFTLYALDGWDEEDIANVQGRTADEVRRDIDQVRQMLRNWLCARSGDGSSHVLNLDRKEGDAS